MSANTQTGERKKRGNRGDFHGLHLQFLTVNLERYTDASKKSKTPEFWRRLFKIYWVIFPWRLAINHELEGEPAIEAILPVDEEVAEETPIAAKPLSEEELASKTELVVKIEKKIKQWYNYRRTATGLAGNPFASMLTQLRRPTMSAPRRLTNYQFYMQHPDYKEKVQSEFLVLGYDKKPVSLHLNFRCKVAQNLLASESEKVKEDMKKGAAAEYKTLLVEHEEATEGSPSPREEDQAIARDHLSTLITPLLRSLHKYTGYSLTLLAGKSTTLGRRRNFKSSGAIHAGTTAATKDTKEATFPQWDPVVYKMALDQFTRFIWAVDQSNTTAAMEASDVQAPNSADATATANTNTDPSPAAVGKAADKTSDTFPEVLLPDAQAQGNTSAPDEDSDSEPLRVLDPALKRQLAAIKDVEERHTRQN
ncbi:hypothetical protein B0H19DRAFT_1249515 [Mycena capillaripes]|nr:hypothetical protein B0H19DRAFT_1249515 [Mycena capillaripes]